MRVGITYCVDGSIFSSSRGQTLLNVAQMMTHLGHQVILVFLGTNNNSTWWSDAEGLDDDFIKITDRELLRNTKKGSFAFDLLIDLDGQASAPVRAVAKRSVVLFRHDPSFHFFEKVPYLTGSPLYSLKGVSEVWVWDLLVAESSIDSLQALFENLPVRRVPYLWTSAILKNYLTRNQQNQQEQQQAIHIVESNTSNTSSCIVPLVGASLSPLHAATTIRVFNGAPLRDNRFFQENIHINIQNNQMITYEGEREPFAAWINRPVFVVTHNRFIIMKPGLLDLVWLGLPLFHNNKLLKGTGLGLETTYYDDNDVYSLGASLQNFSSESWNKGLQERKGWVEQAWSFEKGRTGWTTVLGSVPAPLIVQPIVTAVAAPVTAAPTIATASLAESTITVCFSNMWDGFQSADNFFLDLIRHTVGSSGPRVQGIDYTPGRGHLHIRGPFNDLNVARQQSSTINSNLPTVFFSGERVEPSELQDPSVNLFLTHSPEEDNRHIRFPLWLMYLDWFGTASPSRNPNGLPLSLALSPPGGSGALSPLGTKGTLSLRKFCSFVVSNPLCAARNEAFETLNAYKPVSSGGNYKNNIGGPLAALYGGGGGGDATKHAFLQDHTFNLCFENSVAPGYVTEKLLHAKLAGCVPLYGGAPEALTDFDPSGIVVCNEKNVLDIVQQLEANPDLLARIAATPALSPPEEAKARRLLRKVGTALVGLVNPSLVIQTPIFCTFANDKFYSCLVLSLQSIDQLSKRLQYPLRYIAYIGTDIGDEKVAALVKRFPFLESRRLPATSPVEGFPDFLEPAMFGWKLWILKELCSEKGLEGQLLQYTDAGASWLSLPEELLRTASSEGLALLYDSSQVNRNWCSERIVQEMNITESELEQNQNYGGFITFRAGHPKAVAFFAEAFAWGSKKSCLFGTAVEGFREDGQAFGHRHDQSILSILRLRFSLDAIDAKRVITMTSLRKAYQCGSSVYHHRGEPAAHHPVLPKIDDIWVVSLDRRNDRWKQWQTTYRSLADSANRFPAIDGKGLDIRTSTALQTFFQKNDFQWKKGVVGCALSHILLWAQLVSEHPAVNRYLILEDDQRFATDRWRAVWEQATAEGTFPADAELLYLGGVLPGNKVAYEDCLEPVNDVWATVKPNLCFSSTMEPLFHFCTYAYILTRRGAEKLLRSLQKDGCTTSIDHYLNSSNHGIVKYVMRDLIATCFQENDEAYKASQFDNFQRVDTFDSDIWNNKDCFENIVQQPQQSQQSQQSQQPLWNVLTDVLKQAPHSIQTRNTLRESAVQEATNGSIVYRLGQDGTMEGDWLRSMLPSVSFQTFTDVEEFKSGAYILVARPNMEFWTRIASELNAAKKPFRILHLSDEIGSDPLDLYNHPFCKGVVRNYARNDARSEQIPKVHILPLGFAAPVQAYNPNARTLLWSFHGTEWFGRRDALQHLQEKRFEPYSLHFIPSWKHTSTTSNETWSDVLSKTLFVPVPRGNNPETFRLYEALEHGCIPLYVRSVGDEPFWNWIQEHLTLMEIPSWNDAADLLQMFLNNPTKMASYRTDLLQEWDQLKRKGRAMF